MRAERVGDAGDALAADQRDLQRAAVLRLRHERDDTGVDEVGVVAVGSYRTEQRAALQGVRIEVLHQLLEDFPVHSGQLGEDAVVNPVSDHAVSLY